MRLLLDTHIVIWMATKPDRLSAEQHAAIMSATSELYVSVMAAYEYTHLLADGRLPVKRPFADAQELIGFEVLGLPAEAWTHIPTLPMIHRDPVDRLQVAHCLASDLTFVTADRHIRQYPVETI